MEVVEAFIHSVAVTDIGFLVLLRNSRDEKMVPIFIGPMEAQSISMVLMKNIPPRPLTHDLLKNILMRIDTPLKEVHITELRNNTFIAKIFLTRKEKSKEETIEIDARPSDAIALALRFQKQIFINVAVVDEAGIIIEQQDEKKIHESPKIKEAIGKQTNDKLGELQKELETAVKEERYEDAARVRDEIKKIIGEHN
ncbi:bifunctional nuclease domain-containing protein [Spirochaetota bacterium]